MSEDISIQEISNTFRAGLKQYRIFEKGAEIADRIMGLEQHAADLDKSVELKKNVLAEFQAKIEEAQETAQNILRNAADEGDKMIANASKKIEQAQNLADQALKKKLDSLALAEVDLTELKLRNGNLEKDIAEKSAQYKKLNQELEDTRARLRAI